VVADDFFAIILASGILPWEAAGETTSNSGSQRSQGPKHDSFDAGTDCMEGQRHNLALLPSALFEQTCPMPRSTALPQSTPTAAWWWAAALIFAWFLVLRANWWEWSLNPQYSYGTLVPILAILLLTRRWPDRPSPAAPSAAGRTIALICLLASALLLAALQPMVLSNADWRMVPALAAVAGVTMTLCLIYFLGGAPWLKLFAFPVLFFLVAVPWPRPQENAIMSWLMSHNTGLCVEALHWMGYPAEQRGNLIAIPGSLLGVEEACSGIRSLQSNIMIALAVGEFFRLTIPRRIFLFFLGLAAALGGNAIRSLTLSVAACRSGSEAVDQIHDSTGLAVLASSSILVLLAGKLLARKTGHPSPENSDAPGFFSQISNLKIPMPAALAAAGLLLWSASWIGGEAWFRWHESKAPALPVMWTVAPPTREDNAREVPIAERTLDVLLFPDTAYSEQWRGENGWQWQAFYFQWPPGPTSVQSAFIVHDPRVCLGAAGFELETRLPTWNAEANGFRLPFQRYLFRDRGRPVHVFHAVVEDDGTPSGVDNEFSFDKNIRWQNLFAGRRNRGLRVLEFAVRGPTDSAAAEAAAQEWLNRRLVADKQSDK
jgi:exosortase